MALWRRVTQGLRALVRSGRVNADVDDEVADYLERAAADHAARGLSPEAARRAAILENGTALTIREEVRSSGWEHPVETTLQDVRYALRGLRRNPGFTLAVVGTLALGLGSSTAVYSAIRPILLEPLPFPQAD
ncbi:MAG TPA: permease prefix domain 1-containing protein, partial [Gemmatimonadales bacterium]|nr:permease prefix domain 1-containing protein [Gemmatimonadales bacterium]